MSRQPVGEVARGRRERGVGAACGRRRPAHLVGADQRRADATRQRRAVPSPTSAAAAGRPVQRGLGVPVGLCTGEPGVDSAPAATSTATVSDPREVCRPIRHHVQQRPGLLPLSQTPSPPLGPITRAVASPGVSCSSRRSASTAPVWMASTTATARGSSVRMVNTVHLPLSCRLARYVASAAQSCATLGAPAVRCSPWSDPARQ
jgi:hypothetical protein